MGIENQNTRAQASEDFNGPVYDRLKIFSQEIKVKLAENPQHDSHSHWSGSIKKLNLAGGKDQVDRILEINGWDADVFPQELLDEAKED